MLAFKTLVLFAASLALDVFKYYCIHAAFGWTGVALAFGAGVVLSLIGKALARELALKAAIDKFIAGR